MMEHKHTQRGTLYRCGALRFRACPYPEPFHLSHVSVSDYRAIQTQSAAPLSRFAQSQLQRFDPDPRGRVSVPAVFLRARLSSAKDPKAITVTSRTQEYTTYTRDRRSICGQRDISVHRCRQQFVSRQKTTIRLPAIRRALACGNIASNHTKPTDDT